MSHQTTAAPRRAVGSGAAPVARDRPHTAPEGPFWCPALGAGAAAMLQLRAQMDALSLQVGKLPIRVSVTRPMVGQYLVMLKRLAASWNGRNRQALDDAMAALLHFGASLARPATQEALSCPRADGRRAARRLLGALRRCLDSAQAALAALDADFTRYLAHMALASAELEIDTRLVSERLQTGALHALMLSQRAGILQGRLDEARMQEHARAPAGPHALGLRQEICLHASALEGVRRQLDHLRAEQSANRAEAHYLESLMPTLSPYLAALEDMGAAIASLRAGTAAAAHELDQLGRSLEHDAGAAGQTAAELATALVRWQALAAALRAGALS